MCKVSDKLKLCTCKTAVTSLKHYWVFHRFAKDKNNRVIGEIMLPVLIDPASDKFNRKLLIKLLNEGNVFDIEINAAEKDRLQLSFKLLPDQDNIIYGFEFKNNKWKSCEFDWLEWEWFHNEEKNGKIKSALLRKTK